MLSKESRIKKYGIKKSYFLGQKHKIVCSFSDRVFGMSIPPLKVAHLPVDINSNHFDMITQKLYQLLSLLQPALVTASISPIIYFFVN